ncbi:hypothetical protein BX264_3664 [Streptomyces sp. 2333.5]|uniref:hypothetical protein n=1 Tax=Streptomyces sp. 2112.2 TaxID=1881024 RepID=UPI00089C2A7E|nr:hypothetical protein [Streptomyces sp. 2112.2]PJJ03291.1 hypothetical protein BX264_3664 [Streptomyces sp. 2333.5]SED49567.1 hypothetical protein SAMN05428943_3745 [Streptomyces sp. 2314.4]SEE39244.1 hypothetical protein SAMN05428942_3766 [Streptomyces sp. 2112.2]
MPSDLPTCTAVARGDPPNERATVAPFPWLSVYRPVRRLWRRGRALDGFLHRYNRGC